jgi:rhamnose utilization protein RhaD (predicted bifunctional aldolase and dehydrogenase)
MSVAPPAQQVADELTALCDFLGDEKRQLAILGEGNVSGRVSEDTMLVKATGASLGAMTPADLVEARLSTLLALVWGDARASDADVEHAFEECLVTPGARRPSVEALLHAVAIGVGGATTVAHTHPVSVNSLLCSDRAHALVAGSLFPDQVVVLGRHQILVPYVDPGLALSRVVAERLRAFVDDHGKPPKAIYLVNHGMFALGDSTSEVRRITQMADKVARILVGTLSVGHPQYLTAADADRIDTRPDELLRRQALAHSKRPEQKRY